MKLRKINCCKNKDIEYIPWYVQSVQNIFGITKKYKRYKYKCKNCGFETKLLRKKI